ncbi:IMP cyclohydrolase [Desulfovibrio sp. OttesenSCG-928-I05]|nr:IMP cyclohydrolase [Desulfovibrio sp. OttesenSCG-928-I05]
MEYLPIKRALFSVTDKEGLVPFATFLAEAGVALVSTGGTHAALSAAGLPVTQVSEVTGFPEILGGRVKTLNPRIHGGILADKDDPAHMATLAEHGIETFDLVCVNLYNFASIKDKGLSDRDAIEEIDIGGPCLLRASAKNFHSMLVVPAVRYYELIKDELARNGMRAPLPLRREMAMQTFAVTASYDKMITEYFAR